MEDRMSAESDLFELSTSRLIAAPPETVYRVWTRRTGEWFAPKPYTTPGVELDLRPGGIARMDMQAPDGTALPNQGVFLEVLPNEKLVYTDAFTVGWKPHEPFILLIVTFAPEAGGTRYTATVRHWNAETMKRHDEMGFQEGWGTATDQLAEIAEAEVALA
jgi:uncharacterized protein YndB with AHSA1/START domain